ncbi:hypothetical protein GPECTOR_52g22 [Gonium pectorale]|uniref:Uncharacterized protein n=1 Tax=Gonium pectorale TaxID=33097 RepID=A0A150G8D2_GONPE|nr:hypothetical protein GPECTOR_52g22 [Gonium pectorale]|eukprot:KXZ45620.1 hypothetical protein GPECTOR_52g22 [Gonium pectorale]
MRSETFLPPASPPRPQQLSVRMPSLPSALQSPPPPAPVISAPVRSSAVGAAAGERPSAVGGGSSHDLSGTTDAPVGARRNRRASVDAAAGAIMLMTRLASIAPSRDTAHSHGNYEAGFTSAETIQSITDVLLGDEWRFDDNLQHARMQARYAAASAVDEIVYASLCETAGGGSAGAVAGSGDNGAGAAQRGQRSTWGWFKALASRALRRKGGKRGRKGSGKVAGVNGGWNGADDDDEPVLPSRARDSRVVHRVRLGMDGQQAVFRGVVASARKARRAGTGAAVSAVGAGPAAAEKEEDGDDMTAAITAAAMAFTNAASAPSATGASVRAFAKAVSALSPMAVRTASAAKPTGLQASRHILIMANRQGSMTPATTPVAASRAPSVPASTAADNDEPSPPAPSGIADVVNCPATGATRAGAGANSVAGAAGAIAGVTAAAAAAAATFLTSTSGKLFSRSDMAAANVVDVEDVEPEFTQMGLLRSQVMATTALAPNPRVEPDSQPLPHSAELYRMPSPPLDSQPPPQP